MHVINIYTVVNQKNVKPTHVRHLFDNPRLVKCAWSSFHRKLGGRNNVEMFWALVPSTTADSVTPATDSILRVE